MLLRFLPPLLLLSAVAASNHPPYLWKLCISPLIDSPLDNGADPQTRYAERNYGGECTQKFNYVGSKDEREQFCSDALPFDAEMKDDGETFTCTWRTTSVCPQGWHQIYDTCYRLYSGGSKPCAEGVLENRLDYSSVRWLSIYFKEYQALEIGEPRELLKKQMVTDSYYSDGVAFKFSEKPLSGTKKAWGLIVARVSPFGLYPGDIIHIEKEIDTMSLCRKSALAGGSSVTDGGRGVLPNPQGNPQYTGINGRQFMHMNKIFRVSMNSYQPQIVDGKVNVDYFHQICKTKVCQNCRAASVDEDFKGYTITGRVWVAVGNSKPLKRPSKICSRANNLTKRADFRGTIDEKQAPFIPPEKFWARLPNDLCADGERLAVQYVSDGAKGGFVDVPAFDRQPVMCVIGTHPEAPKEKACYINSFLSNGKCKCKEDKQYVDALDTPLASEVKFRGVTEKGHICLPPPDCTTGESENNPYGTIIFLVDGSGSIEDDHPGSFEKARQFVYKAWDFIPRGMNVILYQYAYDNPTGHPRWHGFDKGNNLTKEEYDDGVNKTLGHYLDQFTPTYTAIIDVLNHYTRFIGGKPPLLILITDGSPNDNSISRRRIEAKYAIKTTNTKVIVVAVGVDPFTFRNDVDDYNKDVLALSDYNKLDGKVRDKIVEVSCSEYSTADLDAAFKTE